MLAIIFESIGVGEWLVLLAVVLIVVGPNRLPSTARKFGQYYAKFRRAAEGFKRQLLEMDTEITNAVREAEKAVDDAEKEAASTLGVDDGASYDEPTDYYGDSGFDGVPPEAEDETGKAEPAADAGKVKTDGDSVAQGS